MPRPYPEALFHVTPLHYAPFLQSTGVLYAQSELRRLGLPILPRRTATRRDRKLYLDGYVHLSLTRMTPLLRDKLVKGYPHVLLEFDVGVLQRPEASLLPWNPKSWRHRDDFAPITDPTEKEMILQEWQAGRYPSAEVLVPRNLPLVPEAKGWFFATEAERDWLFIICEAARITPPDPATVAPQYFPGIASFEWLPFQDYGIRCSEDGQVLPPPNLPFD